MDETELGSRLNRLTGELGRAHKDLRTRFPDDCAWVDEEMAGIQYRLAVLRASLSRRQAATV